MDIQKPARFRSFVLEQDLHDVLEWDKEMKRIDQRRYLRKKTKRALFKEYCTEPGGLFILEYDREKAGFLWLNTRYDEWKDDFYIYLHFVFVAPQFRGMGFGKLLMEKADEYTRQKGIRRLYLGTHGMNTKAHQLYKNAGYALVWVNYEKRLPE